MRSGVVLEVTSSEPSRGHDVAAAKDAIAAAIERGHPNLVLRGPRHGRAARRDEEHPDGEPGSASRLLERNLLGWPKRSAFPVIFVAIALALYAGAIAVMIDTPIPLLYEGQTLDWDKPVVKWIVAILGVVVTVVAIAGQQRLFPAVEVATLTTARRVTRALTSWATVPVVAGALVKLPYFDDLFSAP